LNAVSQAKLARTPSLCLLVHPRKLATPVMV
jgi:hypothetical protein